MQRIRERITFSYVKNLNKIKKGLKRVDSTGEIGIVIEDGEIAKKQ